MDDPVVEDGRDDGELSQARDRVLAFNMYFFI